MITAKEARELVSNWNPEGPFIESELERISEIIKDKASEGCNYIGVDVDQYSENTRKAVMSKLMSCGFRTKFNPDCTELIIYW